MKISALGCDDLKRKCVGQHLDAGKLSDALSLEKDVDGFNPVNIGNLAMRGREPLFIPCAPKGCIELLLRSGVEISGKKVVVVGKSNIVGLPASLLFQVKKKKKRERLFSLYFESNEIWFFFSSFFQRHHATVSIVDSFTENPEHITREGDIVIVATGVPNLVRGHWLKPGAVVIDVGTNPIEVSFSFSFSFFSLLSSMKMQFILYKGY